ncbi:MAG: hypothetical protein Q9227_003441 [Pyrenula ochraceoflavens]
MVAPPSTGPQSFQTQATVKTTAPPSHTNIPYSARKGAALDMASVERKGHPSSRDPPKRNRPHGLPEAPVYRPTEEEFKDPMEFMRKIVPEASRYGICKVIPPDSWNPDFAIDLERFHFKTRRQELNSVEGGTRSNLNYLDQLAKFHKQYGTNLNRFPSVDKRPLDLYKLKKAVEVRGGFEKVCKTKKWAEIGRDLGYSGKIMSSLSTSLKNSYQRWLHPYEEYLRTAKPGLHQQLEFENGGPFSPSPAQTPMNQSVPQEHLPFMMRPQYPVLHASAALNATVGQPTELNQAPPIPAPSIEAPKPMSSGFTAVNSGGFAAVNVPSSGFTAVNSTPQGFVKREVENGVGTPNSLGGTPAPGKSTPVNGSLHDLPNGHATNPLKRTISHESLNGDNGSDAGSIDGDAANGRRSKRIKKDAAPTVAGSHMGLMRPSTPRMRTKNPQRKCGDKCQNCGKTEDRESILGCDSCDLGYHKYCLDPPLAQMPDYDWQCPRCLVGTGEYGFEEGGIYSLKQFQEKANNFKDNYFTPRMPFDPILNTRKKESEDDIEREFWRLVESLTDTVEVEYGADIHSTTHGSGFPTVEKQPLNSYSKDPWNLNVLPFHEESLFRHIKTDVSGMTVPWLYVGMVFSTFCWHNEDHYTYSANYQHFGATKTWYGIPGSDAYAFEDAMKRAVPELFETQPDLLFQLVTLLPPDQLRKAGVNVYALDQRAGQIVITFPQAYHAGFNHGFNFNEAVNFAPSDWEPFGEAGVRRLQEFRRQPCFSHDELLLTATAADSTIKTAKWLSPALQRMKDRELADRQAFLSRHLDAHPHVCKLEVGSTAPEENCALNFVVEDEDLPEDESQCQYCKAYLFLSQFRCHHSSKVYCLTHSENADCCAEDRQSRLLGPNHTLWYRFSNQNLVSNVQKVVDKARIPEAWQEKLDYLLDNEAKPSLKAMHSLLIEGEKIPLFLPGLKDLGDFVHRCEKWVEEANNYITRKQQNRRKNEKAWRRTSTKAANMEERDKELRSITKIHKLLQEAENLSFDAVQITTLQERAAEINDFRHEAKMALRSPANKNLADFRDLLERGKAFQVDMAEVNELEEVVQRMEWLEEARNLKENGAKQTLAECKDFVQRALDLKLHESTPDLRYYQDLCRQGELWEVKANEIMSAEGIHYPQLEALNTQITSGSPFPVNPKTLEAMDRILSRNREAHQRIIAMYEKSQQPELRDRPTYVDVREIMEALNKMNSKPAGTPDLERELRRHEDWMRKGKKLFGKANAPLHILKSHMEYVELRNNYCFDLNDTYRPPIEPASRSGSPTDEVRGDLGDEERAVFCICRMPEAGMMIECGVCHDWYHGKCLKIARGKVKDNDSFTCPICDWTVKIPRDAARPKLEDLQDWQNEIDTLPFQPDEEDVLDRIIRKAADFRAFVGQFINPNNPSGSTEEMPTMLFYLRKLEGAEVLLAYETNLFRQELHKWQPIAERPPPILNESLSTRKPRPTKQQKIMTQLGITDPADIPTHLRTKAHMVKRKSTDNSLNKGQSSLPLQPSIHGSPQEQVFGGTPTPSNMVGQTSTGNMPSRNAFDMPTTSMGMSRGEDPFDSPYPGPPRAGSPLFGQTSTIGPIRDNAFAADGFKNRHDALPLFEEPEFDRDLRAGLADTAAEAERMMDSSPPPQGNEDDMFAEMTNQDGDAAEEQDGDVVGEDQTLPTTEEQETSHATEALDALNDAQQGEQAANGAEEDKKEADDFLES